MEVQDRARLWGWAANFTDFLHLGVVIPYLIFGKHLGGEIGGNIWIIFLATTLTLQAVTLGCPMVVLSSWMRQKINPHHQAVGSLTLFLYQRYGRLKGMILSLGVLTTLVLVTSALIAF